VSRHHAEVARDRVEAVHAGGNVRKSLGNQVKLEGMTRTARWAASQVVLAEQSPHDTLGAERGASRWQQLGTE
jgi:hypothetical protein